MVDRFAVRSLIAPLRSIAAQPVTLSRDTGSVIVPRPFAGFTPAALIPAALMPFAPSPSLSVPVPGAAAAEAVRHRASSGEDERQGGR